MPAMDPYQAYLDEAQELLENLEDLLLRLDQNPEDTECIAGIFRTMHTIKGSGGMFGYSEIARFTHDIETVFDKVRSREIQANSELVSLTFQAKDHLLTLLRQDPAGEPAGIAASDAIIAAFRPFLGSAPSSAAPAPSAAPVAPPPAGPSPTGQPGVCWLRYRPAAQAFFSGVQPLMLLDEVQALGKTRLFCHDDDVPPLAALEPDTIHCWWDVLVLSPHGIDPLRDIFIFEDDAVAQIHPVGPGQVRDADLDAFADTLHSLWQHPPREIQAALAAQHHTLLGFRTAAAPDAAPPPAAPARQQEPVHSGIRVDSQRLDHLVNMVGELVILQSRLTQATRWMAADSPVYRIAEDLERLADELRDTALGLRMLPIGSVVGALRRLVRDAGSLTNKEVELLTEGEETEMDKTVIDRLKDPLMHILRNAVDHGIEAAAIRHAAGKPPKGVVRLAAWHESGEVVIQVSDDGAGVNAAAVHAKAVERGLIAPEAELSYPEICNLLFLPGFSTAAQVSNLSGRGVGMDVVKQSIDALRGTVTMDSVPGQGSTLRIRLPLTLAIIDGLHVVVGKESYIIPLAHVEACQERTVQPDTVREVDAIERMGHLISCISLRALLEIPGDQPEFERVIIVSSDGKQVGLAVDAVVGRQQAVIKPLADIYSHLKWLSGATVSGDGGISLILDVAQLVRHAQARALGS
ncbi:chemotaxis protein CheA [Megalodesulfovibrio gigas]|uniref:Chemotaxis protein CheA n=1 Tax=Megalodesulfovibrio gigas (strain ATCC 19364 / DSM 1382 / NCIMB 9332 / VKM B-1759) TaxID=1121448 RepID=T2G6V2_MEGG1|nr:chemotaxis protein CheA [Megalodesulfovibrio gigas]AGW12320.1 putative chemotaxis protein CheA [Megalodesulfovibrio gigas DSM 1382 = ATCC 19364]